GRFAPDPGLATDVALIRAEALKRFRAALGPYAELSDSLRRALPEDSLWVRDITLSNSTWGNRLFALEEPYLGIHPLGGGIGQGLALAIGAAIARPGRKTALLAGDGGFMLNVGELATLVQERL